MAEPREQRGEAAAEAEKERERRRDRQTGQREKHTRMRHSCRSAILPFLPASSQKSTCAALVLYL
jgi:hypothetical protein